MRPAPFSISVPVVTRKETYLARSYVIDGRKGVHCMPVETQRAARL